MPADPFQKARAVAARYLGIAPRSRAEIEKRLLRDDFAPEIIEKVIEELAENGWVDDTKLAQDWVADRGPRKGYGRTRLKQELKKHGVTKETMEEALPPLDPEEEKAHALAAAERKWNRERLQALSKEQRMAEKRRCAAFLQRRGFNWDTIKKVLNELM